MQQMLNKIWGFFNLLVNTCAYLYLFGAFLIKFDVDIKHLIFMCTVAILTEIKLKK